MLSERIKKIGISPTMKIAAQAIAMRNQGIDVVDFSVGEPDFPTPEFIKEAGKKAIDENHTRYTVNAGTRALREAIAEYLYRQHHLQYDPSQIVVTNGAKQAIFNVILSLIAENDEVLIPAPYWVSYPEMVRLAGGNPVFIEAKEENGFKISAEQLKNAISANTRAIILCNPSNPTGAAYSQEELQQLATVLEGENIYVIADEIYEKLIYDDFRLVSFAAVSPKMKEQTIVINGFSKAFSMTGWRIGYMAGPKEIVEAANKIQSHSTSNANTISQYAALAALQGPAYEINRMVAEFQKRRNYVMQRLAQLPGLSCHQPEGAFYVFPNVSAYFGKEADGHYIRNSYGLAYYLLKEARVVVVPGAAFGSDHHIRISYSTSMEQLEKGFNRIAEALRKLKTPARVKYVHLNNYHTKIKHHVSLTNITSVEQRSALLAESEAHLKYDQYFEWNANINGLIIQLRTNNPHLYDFWVENWYPAQLESDLEPHGVIYAVDGVVGREPYGFYHAETSTAFLFNSDYYATLRSLALGMVADLGQRLFDMHAVRGFSGDFQGLGFVIMGPKGTQKTPIFYHLLQDDSVALHSNDLFFVRYGGGFAAADSVERKFYVPTQHALYMEAFKPLFERSKCENVITKRSDCTFDQCPFIETCIMDRGFPYCFLASKISAAMLDPYWIGGMQKHVKRIDVQNVFLLTNDPLAPPIRALTVDEAVSHLAAGQAPGAVFEKQTMNVPFYNPHLIALNEEKIELQKQQFRRLFDIAECYQINVNQVTARGVAEKILTLLQGGTGSAS